MQGTKLSEPLEIAADLVAAEPFSGCTWSAADRNLPQLRDCRDSNLLGEQIESIRAWSGEVHAIQGDLAVDFEWDIFGLLVQLMAHQY